MSLKIIIARERIGMNTIFDLEKTMEIIFHNPIIIRAICAAIRGKKYLPWNPNEKLLDLVKKKSQVTKTR